MFCGDDCHVPSGGCSGGWSTTAIRYVRENGILFEDCFGYEASNLDCSSTCDTKHNIEGFEMIDSDIEAIKHALKTKGPLSISLVWAVEFDEKGIGRCGDRSGSGHAVTLVGYNNIEGYWIIKNSWGPYWHDEGYGKIGYGECKIEIRRRPFAMK